MKRLLQILFFLLTWFNLGATPPFSKVALPNYAVSFHKTTNQNQESEVKIGVSNFARSSILENSFSQKANLQESYVLENRARGGNDRVVSGAGSFSLSFKPTWKSSRIIQTVEGKTTTLIGSYGSDMKYVLQELNYPKSTNFGPKSGEFNLLNVPDDIYVPATFWDDFNKPWLQAATNRGDDIIIMSNKLDNSLLIKDGAKTGFGKEIDFMEDLVSKGQYRYDDALGKYIAN